MSAITHITQPLDYAKQSINFNHIPKQVTVKGHADYVDFMQEKLAAKNERIDYLEETVGYLKSDRASLGVAVAGLLMTLGIVMYQWLVVCGGNAPSGF